MEKTKAKRLKLKQGTPEWHGFRSLGIGSSEASVISGHLPQAWDGYYSLKLYKTGKAEKFFSDEKMKVVDRGTFLEPKARRSYIKLTGNKVTPACFVHPEKEWVRASLDGIDKLNKIILEIKCSGENVYNKVAIDLKVPEYYLAQMQHQMAVVPSAEKVHFYMYDPDKGGVLMEVYRDNEFIEELMYREEWFWNALSEERRIYSGMLGKPIPIKHNYKVLHNAVKEKETQDHQPLLSLAS
jgi:putative phage-type endonuclease